MKWIALPMVLLAANTEVRIQTNGETRNPVPVSDVVEHIHATMVGGHGARLVNADVSPDAGIDASKINGIVYVVLDAGVFPPLVGCASGYALTSDGGSFSCTSIDEAETERTVIKFVTPTTTTASANWLGNDNAHTAASTCTAPAPDQTLSEQYKASIVPYVTPGVGGMCAVVVSTATAPAYRPKYKTWVRTGSDVAYFSVQAAIEETAAFTVREVAQGADAGANDFIGIGMDSYLNNGQWVCCSGDGTLESCALFNGGVGLSANTTYELELDWSTSSSSFTCSVNGVSMTKSSNVSTTWTNLRMRLQHGGSMFGNRDGGANGNITAYYRYMIMSQGESFTLPH